MRTYKNWTLSLCRNGKSLLEGRIYASRQSGIVGEAVIIEGHAPSADCHTLVLADGKMVSYLQAFGLLRDARAHERSRYRRQCRKVYPPLPT